MDVEQGSYALVNLMARFDFSKQVSATLNLNNVFDRKYYDQIGFYSQGWYGAPRNVMLTMRAVLKMASHGCKPRRTAAQCI